MSPKKHFALVPKLLLAILSFMVVIIACEWGLRVFNIERLPFTNPELYQVDAELSFTMKPNARYYSHGTWFETNKYGLRSPDWDTVHSQNKRCVMFLGDSVVVGFGVTFEESLVNQFTQLNDRDLVGINLGHCGYNYDQEFRIAKRYFKLIKPVTTVMMFVSNDFDKPYDIFNPRINGQDNHRSHFEPIKRILRRYSVLYAFLRKRFQRLREETSGKSRESLINGKLNGLTAESRAHYKNFETGLKEIMDLTNCPLVLCAFPMGLPENCIQQLKAISNRVGASWLDIGVLWENQADYLQRSSLGWDGHPNANAHQQMAKLIINAVNKVHEEDGNK